jgi:hypothetical protein
LAGCLTTAQADTSYFADGVTLDSGWFDTNKAYNPGLFYSITSSRTLVENTEAIAKYFEYTDYNMCWAASTSNILEYMYSQSGYTTAYSSTYLTDTGNATINSLLKTVSQYATYESFLRNFTDEGYTAVDGMAWYTTGTTAYIYGSSYTEPYISGSGGYFQDTVGTTAYDFQQNVLATSYQFYGTGYAGNYMLSQIASGSISYTDLFQEALEWGPIALSIGVYAGKDSYGFNIFSYGHAITCWGYDLNDEGDLSAIYITDSDDGTEALRRLNVTIDATTKLLNLSEDDGGVTSNIYDEKGNIIGKTMSSYSSGNTYSVGGISSFKNFIALVPEPSTATLCLIGLGSLLVRRRKRAER